MQEVNFKGIEDKIPLKLICLKVLVNFFLSCFLCAIFIHKYDSIRKLTNLKFNFKLQDSS